MEILALAEEKFLRAAGWRREGRMWRDPVSGFFVTFGHAVNSEKLHGFARGTHNTKDLGELLHAEIEYLLRRGWRPSSPDSWWRPPKGCGRKCQQHGRAVNGQKGRDRR